MAFQRGGIELIAGNVRGFISSLGKVNRAYDQMNKAAGNAAKQVTKTGDQVTAANRRMERAQNNLIKAQYAEDSALKRLQIAEDNYNKELSKGAKVNADKLISLDRLVGIYDNQYKSALLTTTNAQESLTAAQEAATAAQNANTAAMGAGAASAKTASTVFAVLGVAVAGITIALGAATIAWRAFSSIISFGIGIINKLIGVVKSAARGIINFFSRAFSTALGFGIFDLFRNISSGINNMVSELGDAIGFFQRLRIQLEALSARDIAQETLIPMSDAFKLATDRAEALETWIKNIAVRTPFTAQGIAQTLAMANAMGLTIGTAKRLTGAVIDFTSAMGLTEDHMYRIIYNFGQMLAQGKLNGREFRDLANSFVPVWRMLDRMAQQTGKTTEEFKKLAFEGKVPVEAFFNEFIRLAEEDFAGAAGKMARTLTGVANNFRDFIQIILGTSVLGPVMDRIAEKLSNALDFLLRPEFRRAAEQIGRTLLSAFTQIEAGVNTLATSLGKLATAFGIVTPGAMGFSRAIAFVSIFIRRVIERVAQFVTGLSTNLSTNFQTLAKNFATWGYNIVASFAKGMSAAIKLIVLVINTITRILTYWFKGLSPPRIAPNIDKWGANMISEWVKGWTKFDISAFSDIADTVESFLRSIAFKIGGKDEVNLIPRILGARQTIANAINAVRKGFSTIEEAARRVVRQVGNLTSEFKDYIIALFDVAALEKKVADAAKDVADAQSIVESVNKRIKISQDELNAVNEKYDSILKDLNNQLRQVTEEYDEQLRLNEINAAIGTGLLTDAEKERLEMEKRSIGLKQQIRTVEDERDAAVDAIEARITALEAERDAAQLRQDAAEAAEQAAQNELDAAQERLDLTKAIIDEQIKQNELIQDQINLLKKLAEASASGGAGAIEDLSEAFGDFGDTLETVTGKSKLLISKMRISVDNFIKGLEGMSGALDPLTGEGGALSLLNESMTGLYNALFGISTEVPFSSVIGPAGNLFAEAETPASKFSEAVDKIAKAFSDFDWDSFADALVKIAQTIADTDWTKIADAIISIIDAFEEWSVLVAEEGPVVGTLDTIHKKFTEYFAEGTGLIPNILQGFWNSTLLGWTILKLLLVDKSIVPEMMEAIDTVMRTTLEDLQTWFDNTWLGQMVGSFTTFMTDSLTEFETGLGNIKTEWETRFEGFKTYVNGVFNDPDGIVAKVKTAMDGLATFFGLKGTLATAIMSFINNVLDALISKLETAWNWILKIKGAKGTENTDGGNFQHGGIAFKGTRNIVGEKGRELFIPAQTGLVLPNWLTERILAPPMMSQGGNTYITNVEVNPSYANMQSEASVYYDVTAALSAARR